jgi:hypothetical protein
MSESKQRVAKVKLNPDSQASGLSVDIKLKDQTFEQRLEDAARRRGFQIYEPVFRSMLPSRSRGQAAQDCETDFKAGAHWAREQMQGEIDRIETINDRLSKEVNTASAQNEDFKHLVQQTNKQKAEIARLREALEKYRDIETFGDLYSCRDVEGGRVECTSVNTRTIAREALKGVTK